MRRARPSLVMAMTSLRGGGEGRRGDDVVATGGGPADAFGRGAPDDARGRQGDQAGHVGLVVGGGRGSGALVHRDLVRADDAGAAIHGVHLDDLGELLQYDGALAGLAAEQLGELGDVGEQLVAFVDDLLHLERGEAPQLHVEDVGGLGLAEVELAAQFGAGLVDVGGASDDAHDQVDVVEGDDEALDDVQAFLGPAQPVLGAAHHDVEAVLDVVATQVVQAERLGYAVDEDHVVDAEGLLERGLAEQLGQDRLGTHVGLERDEQPEPGLAIREVLGVDDAVELAGHDEFVDPLDDLLGSHQVGEFGDDDALAAAGQRLDLDTGPDAEASPTGLVRIAQAVVDDDAARREVRAGHQRHQLVDGGLGSALGHDQFDGRGDLGEIVGGHVGGHAHGDAAGAVDQQIGQQRRQVHRLGALAVVGGAELDGVLVDLADHLHRGVGEAALGVARCGRWVVEAAEVAVGIDEGDHPAEVLAHAHQGLVDGHVAVRVVLAHGVADDARALAVGVVGAQAHLEHREEDAALDRLEAVADVGDGPRRDDRQRIGEERLGHLVGDGHVDDFSSEREQLLLARHGDLSRSEVCRAHPWRGYVSNGCSSSG